ncbi:MAG TPA: TlpA family protein disulfide reductase [bacterium]|nr:TlpA family protein disulfide reductase [bacterium]
MAYLKKTFIITAAMAVAAMVAFGAAASAQVAPGTAVGSLKIESASGPAIDLGAYGKPYVLAFFVPGRDKDAAQLAAISKLLKKKEFAKFDFIIATRGANDAEKKRARDFLSSGKYVARLAFDTQSHAAKKLGVTQFPAIIIVDAAGAARTTLMSSVTEKMRKRSFEDFLKAVSAGATIPYIDLLPRGSGSEQSAALIGKPAPAFSLKDLSGKNHKLSDYKGKNIILIFWSPSCGHCMAEMPKIQSFLAANSARYNLKVLGVTRDSGDNSKKDAQKAVKEKMVTYPNLMDPASAIMTDYGVKYVPSVFFINEKGVIVEHLSGAAAQFDEVYHSIFADPGRLGGKSAARSAKGAAG